jgi:hypothetical protein
MTVTRRPNNQTDINIVKRRPGGGRRFLQSVQLGETAVDLPAGFKGRALKAKQAADELGVSGLAWVARVYSPDSKSIATANAYANAAGGGGGNNAKGCCVNCGRGSALDPCNSAN